MIIIRISYIKHTSYNVRSVCIHIYLPSLTPAVKSEIMVSSKKIRAVSPMISSSADDITFEVQQDRQHSTLPKSCTKATKYHKSPLTTCTIQYNII